jgi:L-alanine-DL-glutamate epimerase-like enolase superfamily enzyme
MPLFGALRDLPLTIESYDLELLAQGEDGGERITTAVHLQGGGEEGVGEDVVYEPEEHHAHLEMPRLPLAGTWTLQTFSSYLGTLALFPTEPGWPASQDFRRWAFESAALDLALRQSGTNLADALSRTASPVRFVHSRRLGDPPDPTVLLDLAERIPGLGFKLDPEPGWDDVVITALADTGAVQTLDLKGHYVGSTVDPGADADLYRRVIDAFPDAWVEDPRETEETAEILAACRERVSWDAPLHRLSDITDLVHVPTAVNVKPSRFGRVEELMAVYDHLEATGILAYGGGQAEVGPGRGHIQYLAALFHPDAPNDVAPAAYNLSEPPADLPGTPLAITPAATGFRLDV